IVRKDPHFVHFTTALQIKQIVFVAGRRVDLALQKRVQALDAPAAKRNKRNVSIGIKPQPLQRLASDPVLAAVWFTRADFFSFELLRAADIWSRHQLEDAVTC